MDMTESIVSEDLDDADDRVNFKWASSVWYCK
jgi:hypothetical protein